MDLEIDFECDQKKTPPIQILDLRKKKREVEHPPRVSEFRVLLFFVKNSLQARTVSLVQNLCKDNFQRLVQVVVNAVKSCVDTERRSFGHMF